MKSSFDIDIDILGACNLRCPSCPQGNVKDYRLPQGFMEPELLKQIVKKAQTECRNVRINLYNWAEPLLHPRLCELIDIIRDAGIPCHLSSNLKILPNADALMAANPASLRISISGFSQEIYGRTHRGGDIERVKQHMVELAAAKKRNKASTRLYVFFHRYRHNLREEPLMREFATNLGIYFHPAWALFFPLEKLLAFAGENVNDFPITEEDKALISCLALPLEKSLEAGRKYGDRPCPLREESISLDFKGNFTLCCGIYNARNYTLGNFLDMPLTDIQKLRRSHHLCGLCTKHGCHLYLTFGIEELDELALANISPEDVRDLGLRYEIAWERWHKRLTKSYGRFFSGVLASQQKEAIMNRFFQMKRFFSPSRHQKNR